IKQDTEAVDIAACIDIETAHLGLLGTHVSGGANELVQLRIYGEVGEAAFGGFGDAKIDYFRHGHSVMESDQDIGRLDIAMNDAFLVGVLDGLTNLCEKIEALAGAEIILVTIFCNFYAAHQLHDEKGAASGSRAGIEHLGDVGMVHHGEGLAFGFE